MVKEFIQRARKFFDAAPEAALSSAHTKRTGTTGTEIYAGYPAEEYLNKLRGYQRAKVFDEFKRSDTQARMLLSAVKNPIKSATWCIEPVKEENKPIDPQEQEIADFVKYVIFCNSNKPFKKFISEVLTMVEHGHAAIEKTYKPVLNDPKWGSFMGIAGLDMVSQKTIQRWFVDHDTGKLTGIEQIANGDLQSYVTIPAEYLMVFNTDMEGSNYEGISWLRPCFGNWLRKNVYLKLNAIGIEKFAVPTPIISIDDGFQGQVEQYGHLIAALEVYTSGESNYMIKPKSVDMLMQPNTFDPQKVDQSIDSEDKRMAKAFVANFLELGNRGGGSHAQSADMSDFYLSGLIHLADEICDPVNAQLIPEIVQMKYGPRSSYPRLTCSGIDDKAGQELANAMSTMTTAGLITPDDTLENNLRQRFSVPVIDKDTQRLPAAPAGTGTDYPPKPGDKPKTLAEVMAKRLLRG